MLTFSQQQAICRFVDEQREAGAGFGLQVRTVKLARALRVKELRTDKNDYLAAAYDELGNAFILRRDGTRTQLVGREVRAMGLGQ